MASTKKSFVYVLGMCLHKSGVMKKAMNNRIQFNSTQVISMEHKNVIRTTINKNRPLLVLV